jgi:pyroglutamyl-peptidase I
MKKKIDSCVLVMGFEPFDKDTINPSWEVARALDNTICEGSRIQTVQLPCVFGRALEKLDAALVDTKPHLVILLGLANGRSEITPERIAINVNDARIPDNNKQQPIDTPVVKGGPAAYFTTLPIKAIVKDLRANGIPASVSNTAGTFVCNHAFYGLMHRLATMPDLVETRGGFVHLPHLPEQSARIPGVPSMALATQVEGIKHLIQTALTVKTDIRADAGREH